MPCYDALNRLALQPETYNDMANMSYCRFPNTLRDLQDIQESLSDDEGISPEQKHSALELLELCAEIAGQFNKSDITRLVAKHEKENE